MAERARMWRAAFGEADPRWRCLVAEAADGAIVGFVAGGPPHLDGPVPLGTDGEVYAIYLLGRVKRRGIGRGLMAGIFDHFLRSGFASAGLWVLSGNADGRRFYEALGGRAGPEKPIPLGDQTVMEISYRFETIPRLAAS